MYYCNQCSLLHVTSSAQGTGAVVSATHAVLQRSDMAAGTHGGERPALIVIGLGNLGDRHLHTPHNVGRNIVDLLAERLGERGRVKAISQ